MSQKALTYAEALTYLASIQNGTSLPKVQSRVIRSGTKYIAGLAADLSGKNGLLIEAATLPATGLNNFPKGNMLPKGTYLLVIGARILFDTSASVALPTATWKSEAPANWKNGELKISQNGTGILFETSITDVTNFKSSTGNDDDFRDIVPVLLRPESAFDFQVALASGAVTDQAYKLELRVIEIVDPTGN